MTSFNRILLILFLFTFPMEGFSEWLKLEPGLELGRFNGYWDPEIDDSKIKILRIDPVYFELILLNTSALDEDILLTTKEWSKRENLVAAINASMYRQDYKTSVSYMRTKKHINNPFLTKDKSVLAFSKTGSDIPDVKIIDRQCDSFDRWKSSYTSFVQSIRMISCKGKNVWAQQPQKWSIAAVATDNDGRVLFIHSKLPYTTHDFIDYLLSLKIGINRAMYSEGGAEAQLYIRSGSHEYEYTGVPESRNSGFQFNLTASPIPNVIGIKRKQRSPSE